MTKMLTKDNIRVGMKIRDWRTGYQPTVLSFEGSEAYLLFEDGSKGYHPIKDNWEIVVFDDLS